VARWVAHLAHDTMAMLDVEGTALHREEYDFGIEPVDHEVSGVGQKAMVVLDVEGGCRRPWFSHREADESRTRIDCLSAEDFVERQGFRLQEQSRIGGQNDLPMNPELFEKLTGMTIPNRDDGRLIERIAYPSPERQVRQRPRADRIDHDGRPRLMCQEHLAQVQVGVCVVEDAPPPRMNRSRSATSSCVSRRERSFADGDRLGDRTSPKLLSAASGVNAQLSTGRVARRIAAPRTPAAIEPIRIPSFAWRSR
jgi:hypothetical protein